MVQFTDTEGAEIPLDDDETPLFDLTLWGDGHMSMSVPFFETELGVYDSPGNVLEIELRDILQEYLSDYADLDDGDGLLPLAKMLREFADLYENTARSNHAAKTPQP